jgi:hypothetical protein
MKQKNKLNANSKTIYLDINGFTLFIRHCMKKVIIHIDKCKKYAYNQSVGDRIGSQ